MKRSKNINMFLMDGEVTGIIKCTLSNWTGVIYKIPRIQLADLKSRDEMKQSGIYFLFGRDENKQRISPTSGKRRIAKTVKASFYVCRNILVITMPIILMMQSF